MPVAVSGGLVFMSLVAGGTHTCGLTISGAAYCWGDNLNGQLGNGTSENWSATPGPVSGGLVFTGLIVGASHTCGITNNGVARCWGWNVTGQLGDGSTIDRATPTVVLNP
jgi:alpha-tubulin suppressor-like RCC1 family protein